MGLQFITPVPVAESLPYLPSAAGALHAARRFSSGFPSESWMLSVPSHCQCSALTMCLRPTLTLPQELRRREQHREEYSGWLRSQRLAREARATNLAASRSATRSVKYIYFRQNRFRQDKGTSERFSVGNMRTKISFSLMELHQGRATNGRLLITPQVPLEVLGICSTIANETIAPSSSAPLMCLTLLCH